MLRVALSRSNKLTKGHEVSGAVTADTNKFYEPISVLKFLITRLIIEEIGRSDLLVVALILKYGDRVFSLVRIVAGGSLCCVFQSRLAA